MLEYEKDGAMEERPMLRYYRVFHVDDVLDIPKDKIPDTKAHDHDFDPIGECDRLVEFWSDSPKIELRVCVSQPMCKYHGIRCLVSDLQNQLARQIC